MNNYLSYEAKLLLTGVARLRKRITVGSANAQVPAM
jgi:hypothetical protein